MEKLYVARDDESITVILKAESKEEAFDIFAKTRLKDNRLLEEITEFSTDSLLGFFEKDDKGSFYDGYTGGYPERLNIMSDEEKEIYVDDWIEKNIKKFWADQPQFAEEYLRELHKSYESEGCYVAEFSEEFMIDAIKKIICTGKWYDNFEIVEVDLEGKEYQVLYDDNADA